MSKTIRNVSVIDRRTTILDALPSDTSFTLEELKDAIRASGMVSRDAQKDYLEIHLAAYIEKDGDKYRLKGD